MSWAVAFNVQLFPLFFLALLLLGILLRLLDGAHLHASVRSLHAIPRRPTPPAARPRPPRHGTPTPLIHAVFQLPARPFRLRNAQTAEQFRPLEDSVLVRFCEGAGSLFFKIKLYPQFWFFVVLLEVWVWGYGRV